MKLPLALTVATLVAVFPAAAQRGDNPDAKPLSPEEQLKQFKVPPGFEVQLVASEPEIQKPLNLNFDAQGRLWVTGSESYPWPAATDALGKPLPNFEKAYEDIANAFASKGTAPQIVQEGRDTIRVLSDIGLDGRAKTIKVFADKLNVPTGIQPLPRKPGEKGDTVVAYSIPSIWKFTDTDGDGTADKREPLYEGFGYLDTHGMSSNYIYWVDGWIYGCHGFRNHSEIKDRNGNVLVMDSGNTYRFKPDGSKIEYFTHGQTNPFGLAFDPAGNLYSADSHSKPVYMLVRGGYYEGIGKQHDGLGFAPRITDDDHGSSAIAGITYYSDNKWPAEFRGNLFNGNPVTRRINRAKLAWHGSTPKATRVEDFVSCDDPWFRPVQCKLGPDGALYIADFYNPIIGHYEVPLSDPRRDRQHGRIWRVVYKGNGAQPAMLADISKLDAAGLTAKLADPSLETRRIATVELQNKLDTGDSAVAAELRRAFENGSPDQQLHALWVLANAEARNAKQGNGNVNLESIIRIVRDSDARIASAVFRKIADDPGLSIPANDIDALLTAVSSRKDEPLLQQAVSQLIAAHPTSEGLKTLVQAALQAPPDGQDIELAYARRVAIRDALKAPEGFKWAAGMQDPAAATFVADIALAVPTPEAAASLANQLKTTNFNTPRSGEYLKHAATYLPAERLDDLIKILPGGLPTAGNAIAAVAPAQRLAIADGLSEAARRRGMKLPDAANAWIQEAMVSALSTTDMVLLDKAIAAVKDARLDAKVEPLKKVVLSAGHGPRRAAALEALMNMPGGVDIAAAALANPSSMTLRKRAAELLTQQAGSNDVKTGETARNALINALATAPWELATTIGSGLAKSDAAGEQLVALVEAGKVSPALLRNNAVATAFSGRPQALKDRVAALTKDLPPEDARLDAVIAQRVTEFRAAKANAQHGRELFQQQCAACHKVKNVGGNIGPNLDGVASRGIHRLIEDILDPNRNVDPAFRQTIVETSDGRTVAGVNLRTEGALVLLNDATGQEQSLQKSQVKSQTQSRLSLMPPTFEQTLTNNDFNDLLAFLMKESTSAQ